MTATVQYPTPAPIVTSFMSATGERTSVPFQRLIQLASKWNAVSAHMDYPPRLSNPDGPALAIVIAQHGDQYKPLSFEWNPYSDSWQPIYKTPEPIAHPWTPEDDKPIAYTPPGWDAVETDTDDDVDRAVAEHVRILEERMAAGTDAE